MSLGLEFFFTQKSNIKQKSKEFSVQRWMGDFL